MGKCKGVAKARRSMAGNNTAILFALIWTTALSIGSPARGDIQPPWTWDNGSLNVQENTTIQPVSRSIIIDQFNQRGWALICRATDTYTLVNTGDDYQFVQVKSPIGTMDETDFFAEGRKEEEEYKERLLQYICQNFKVIVDGTPVDPEQFEIYKRRMESDDSDYESAEGGVESNFLTNMYQNLKALVDGTLVDSKQFGTSKHFRYSAGFTIAFVPRQQRVVTIAHPVDDEGVCYKAAVAKSDSADVRDTAAVTMTENILQYLSDTYLMDLCGFRRLEDQSLNKLTEIATMKLAGLNRQEDDSLYRLRDEDIRRIVKARKQNAACLPVPDFKVIIQPEQDRPPMIFIAVIEAVCLSASAAVLLLLRIHRRKRKK
jgi:hypothetical protein